MSKLQAQVLKISALGLFVTKSGLLSSPLLVAGPRKFGGTGAVPSQTATGRQGGLLQLQYLTTSQPFGCPVFGRGQFLRSSYHVYSDVANNQALS